MKILIYEKKKKKKQKTKYRLKTSAAEYILTYFQFSQFSVYLFLTSGNIYKRVVRLKALCNINNQSGTTKGYGKVWQSLK